MRRDRGVVVMALEGDGRPCSDLLFFLWIGETFAFFLSLGNLPVIMD